MDGKSTLKILQIFRDLGGFLRFFVADIRRFVRFFVILRMLASLRGLHSRSQGTRRRTEGTLHRSTEDFLRPGAGILP